MIECYQCDESIVNGMTQLYRDVEATGKGIRPGTVGQNKVREDYKKCTDLFFNEFLTLVSHTVLHIETWII